MSDGLICSVCKMVLGSKRSLRRHSTKAHSDEQKTPESRSQIRSTNKSVNCPLCDYSSSQHPALMKHFPEAHGLLLKEEAHDFMSTQEFLKWKEEVEKATKSQFVKVRGSTSIKCIRGKKDVYVCHRSGKFRGKVIGRVRHTKSQGSQKLDAFCPARMKVVTAEGDRVFLNFISTHVGHNKDTAHLRLTRTEKEILAKEVISKKPFTEIVSQIRNSPDAGRLQLLSKQDLQNIRQDGKLFSSLYQGCTVDAWLADKCRLESVLLFKPCGTFYENYPELREDDFAVCLMKDAEIDFLKNLETFSLHTFVSGELNLFSVSAAVDKGAIALVLMITNRNDPPIFELILKKVKLFVEKAKTVFYEKGSFYEAWKMCCGEAQLSVEGSWYTDLKCREALNRTVRNKLKKQALYKAIKDLMGTKDENEFTQNLKQFEDTVLSLPEYEEFNKYFKAESSTMTQTWAHCRRLNKLNEVDRCFGKLHKNLMCIHSKFNSKDTVVPLLSSLWEVVNTQLTAVSSHSLELKCIKSRHRLATNTQGEIARESNNIWTVYVSGPKTIESQRVEKIADSCNCELKCNLCQRCKHLFTCSCFDFSSKSNMCKHIHMVCMNQFSESQRVAEIENVDSVEVVINEGVLSEEVEEGKLEIQLEFNNILSMITTITDVNVVKNAFRLIVPTLTALKSVDGSNRVAQIEPGKQLNLDVT